MRRKWSIAVFLLIAYSCFAQDNDTISEFRSEISVQHDATIQVTERFQVRADGGSIQHGIFRDVIGDGRYFGLAIDSVKRDGDSEPYRVENIQNGRRIYVGSPSVRVSPGNHSYEITYSVRGLLMRDGGYDRLYWNVTGNAWSLPIEAVEAHVNVPADHGAEATAYTGSFGWKGRDFVLAHPAANEFVFTSTTNFLPGTGMTVDVRWPHTVSAPIFLTLRALLDEPSLLVLSMTLIALVVSWLLAWFKAPQRVHVIEGSVLMAPPRNLSPAGLRFAREGALDNKAFTAAVVDLASRGLIHIDQQGDDYHLATTGAHRADLPVEERELQKVLFAGDNEIGLKRDTRRVVRALQAFAAAVNEEYGAFVAAPPVMTKAGWILSAGATAIGLLLASGQSAGFEALSLLVLLAASVAMLRQALHSYRRSRPIGDFLPQLGILMPIGGAVLTALVLVVLAQFVSRWFVVLVGVHIAINLAGEHWFRVGTGEAAQVAAEAEQFRRFLLERSERELEPDIFNRWAGYALALDIEERWLAGFSYQMEKAVTSAPGWFTGGAFQEFYLHSDVFEGRLVRASSRSFAHGFARGSSSGFGSGGGGGGGGGGFGGGGAGGGVGGGGGGGW